MRRQNQAWQRQLPRRLERKLSFRSQFLGFSPDLRTVPGVLLPPPGVPVAPVPDFFVSRLLKKLASTPSLV